MPEYVAPSALRRAEFWTKCFALYLKRHLESLKFLCLRENSPTVEGIHISVVIKFVA